MRYSFDNFINHILLFPVAVSRLAVCGCSVERAGSTRFESLNVWRFENLNIWKTFLHTQNIALNSPKFKTKSKNFCQRYFWKKVCLNSHIMLTECCLSPKILTRIEWCVHTWYLSREPQEFLCKFFLAGVNFYKFNAKNWHFRQILRKKVAFFTDLTRKIGVFRCKFYSPKILPV